VLIRVIERESQTNLLLSFYLRKFGVFTLFISFLISECRELHYIYAIFKKNKKQKTEQNKKKNCQSPDKGTMISLHQILIAIYQKTKVHLHNYNKIKQFYQKNLKKKKKKASTVYALNKLFMSSFFKKGKTFFFFFFGRARQHLFFKKKIKKKL
jgi:hypothetical protein